MALWLMELRGCRCLATLMKFGGVLVTVLRFMFWVILRLGMILRCLNSVLFVRALIAADWMVRLALRLMLWLVSLSVTLGLLLMVFVVC